jgi:phosphonate degradation associated HDIG domain protein
LHRLVASAFLTDMTPTSPHQIVSQIYQVFEAKGHRSYGEDVTELQHALQCATFAQQAGESAEVIVASLLHDYGHLLHDLGEDIADRGVDSRHERVGANQLERWFGPEVVEPIRMHADSKRYLCWKEAGYFGDLSAASKQSLALQGGPMLEPEAKEFEKRPQFDRAIRVRRFDDMGKVPDMKTPTLEGFRPLVESLVRC